MRILSASTPPKNERIWSYDLPKNQSRWTLRDLGGKVLREYFNDGTWTVDTDYLYRDAQLLAAETRHGRRHFHLDHLGTPRLITNGVGFPVAYHVYYPFGEEATAFNQDRERMKFTGHERDFASLAGAGDDLDYMHARHCSPVMGRFLTTDPSPRSIRLRLPQTWNRYNYVIGNPLLNVDPTGEIWFKIDGKWTYLDGVNEISETSTDEEGNLVVTVTAGRDMFLTFDGGELKLYQEDGTTRSFTSVSGELDAQGRTQSDLQGERNRGPVPEGLYSFRTGQVQTFGETSLLNRIKSVFGRGTWPGGQRSWGDKRVELTPAPGTNTYGRNGMFIHGGFTPGSRGCIDLCGQVNDFFTAVGSSPYPILLEVDYP